MSNNTAIYNILQTNFNHKKKTTKYLMIIFLIMNTIKQYQLEINDKINNYVFYLLYITI